MNQFDLTVHSRRAQKADTDRRMAYEKPGLRVRFLDALLLIVGLLCFLALITWMQARDLDDAVEMHRAEAKRVTGMLADCLNGKTLFDRKTNVALFCGRAIEVKL